VAQAMSGVRRRWAIIVAGAVILVAIILSGLSGFYVDILWFREIHFSGVFWTVFWSKLFLGLVFGSIFFVLLLVNLIIARRITPRFRFPSPEQEVIERYRQAIEPYSRLIIPGFALFISLFVGIAAAARWQTFLLWRSVGSTSFGQLDPVFHRDPSFYIFVLPFQKYLQGWLFSSLVGILVIVGVAHYLSGNIRTQGVGERVTPGVRAHVSVLLGLIVLAKAWGYYLGRFDLLVSPRGIVTGASYTDIHVQKPALTLLVYIAIVCALLFIVNVRFRIWALPAIGLILLAVTSTVAGAIVPAAVQRFSVKPQELQRESPFIKLNIEATRFAYDLADVTQNSATPATDLTADQITSNETTVKNIRLWNPDILRSTYDAVQRIQPYYEFADVDVDRYPIEGETRLVMLSAREMSQNGIPGNPGWQQIHLVFTHGYGAVASKVNTATASGAPDFLLKDIPTQGTAIPLDPDTGSQVYFGERQDVAYVAVDTKQKELNYPSPAGGGSVSTAYSGNGGIPIGSFFQKLVFAYRYRDFNLLISNLIDSESKILINRDIRTRIQKAAPFLKYDTDPYVAIVDGRINYIWDAYTTTDLYPYSQRVSLSTVTNPDMTGQVNYMRNSVKAVVDAYDGTVRFYVVDDTDPLIKVWQTAFPHLFTPFSAVPDELKAHFRYPEALLQVQSAQFGRYHVTDPNVFFTNEERWQVPTELPREVNPTVQPTEPFRPYYVLTALPGDTTERFVLFQPFSVYNRPNQMVGYVAAISDPDQYGTLKAFEFPPGLNVDAPSQIRSLIKQDPVVSPQITLLDQRGSNVQFGDLLVVPIDNGFLYVQPIFVVSSANPIPQLKRVVVVHGENATIGNNLAEALAASFGQPVTPPEPGGPPPTTGTVAELLAQAKTHFDAAEAALKAGDLATYQREIEAGIALVNQAAQVSGGPTPSPTPSPSVSPTG
jgi:uncharacterized protein